MKEYLTTAEVAKIMRVSTYTVRRWVRYGHLSAIHTPTGLIRIPSSDVLKYVKHVSGEAVDPGGTEE